MKPVTSKFAAAITVAMNTAAFSNKSYRPKVNAQINLEGKTHYVDDGTLRYFSAHVLSADDSQFGLVFHICESFQKGYEASSGRAFRYVAFDLFGTVICRPDPDTSYSTRAAARKAFYVWFNGFDTVEHYRSALKARALRLTNEAKALRAAARGSL